MGRSKKSSSTSSRALKRLAAHNQSPEVDNENESNENIRSHSGASHGDVLTADKERSAERRGEKRSHSRSRSDGRSTHSSSRRRSRSFFSSEGSRRRRRSSEEDRRSKSISRQNANEPPAWAKQLLAQQQRNADDLKGLENQI